MAVTPDVRATFLRWVVRPAWTLLGALALAFATVAVARALTAGPSPPPSSTVVPRWQFLPLLASVVAFGLPHGAVDHLALPWVHDRPVTPRALAGVGLLYLVLGGTFFAAWFLAPAASFVAFIALTWFHWGQGDLYLLCALVPDAPPTRLRRALVVVVRGGLPMVVPLVAFPATYRRVASLVVGRFDPGAVARLDPLFRPEVRAALGVALLLAALASLALGRRTGGAAWRYDAVETTLLAAYFAVVPPVLAIGVYFPLWHSVRHVARMVVLDPAAREALDADRVGAALGAFARDAAPLTVVALALLGGAAVVVPAAPAAPGELAALYLAVLAAFTLPHTVVVSLLDRQQGLW